MLKKIFLVLLLVFAVVFATGGTATLESGTGKKSCFMFADGVASVPGADPSKCDIAVEPWTYPGWCTNYIDVGTVSLDSMTSPPTTGYNDDAKGYIDCQKVEANHAYWIKTRDGKYGAVKVTEATYVGSQSTGNLNKVTFDWVYLGAGTGNGSGDGTITPVKKPGDGKKPDENCYCTPAAFILLLAGLLVVKSNN